MNAYQRLNDLIIYMCDEKFQATVSNLAQAMGVYEQQIRQDIEYLLSYEAPKGNLLFAPHIKTFLLDNEPCYHMDGKIFSPQGKLLSMTSSQLALYNYAVYVEFNRWEQLTDYDYESILDLNIVSNQPDHDFDTDNLLTIEKAIRMGASIRLSNQTMTPHFIKCDVNTGVLYVIQTYEDGYIDVTPLHEIYRLDIVDSDTYSGKIAIPKETATRVDSIWSFDEETLDSVRDTEPTHIKLMIFEDNADIVENIKRDTYGRCRANLSGPFPYGEKDHTESVYYYEDDVLGLTPFKAWVKQLGVSAIVLEPKELAYEIYRELHNENLGGL